MTKVFGTLVGFYNNGSSCSLKVHVQTGTRRKTLCAHCRQASLVVFPPDDRFLLRIELHPFPLPNA